jgi:quercetin dioxygenase-like cupin family protein
MTRFMRAVMLSAIAIALFPGTVSSQGQVDPKAVEFTKPGDIKFVRNPAGTQETAVLFGDPAKPGPYVIRLRWLPGNMSRPHFHPNDRFFVVISGTWWLGTGEKYDPDSTVPVPAGTYVIHHAGQVHYDGAKDEPAVIQVWGMGPATSTPAEKK